MGELACRLLWLAQFLCASAFAFIMASQIRFPLRSWWMTILVSLNLFAAVIAIAAAAGFLGRRLLRWLDLRSKQRTPALLWLLVLWMVPLAVAIRLRSPISIMSAVIIGAGLVWLWRPPVARELPRFWSAFISLGLHAGVVGWLTATPLLAVLPFGLSAAIVSSRMNLASSRSRRTALSAVAVFLTAILLTPRFLARLPASDPAEQTGRKASARTRQAEPDQSPAGFAGGDEEVGVIMWPEQEKRTLLVPPLPAMRRDLFKSPKAEPLSIPFYGVYWFYKSPYSRPPRNSLVTRGTPTRQTFRSTDFRPLIMEAHQNFGTHIDLRCCSAIQIAVTNADPYQNSVAVELVLLDTESKGPSVPLGIVPITSTPSLMPVDVGEYHSELLTYPIPPRPLIDRFDEVVIRYHLRGARGVRSARVAIDRFIFVPHLQ